MVYHKHKYKTTSIQKTIFSLKNPHACIITYKAVIQRQPTYPRKLHFLQCKEALYLISSHLYLLSVFSEEESVIETGSGAILDPEKVTSLPADSVEIVTQMEDDHLSPIQTETETLIPVAVKVTDQGDIVYHSRAISDLLCL